MKIVKNNLLGFLLGIVLATGITVYATTSILSSNVTYKTTDVESALDDLYDKTDNISVAAKKFCKLESGTINTIGSKYKCKLGKDTNNEDIEEYFYLLSINSDQVELIMDHNLTDTVGSNRTLSWNDAMKFFRTGDGVATKQAWTNVLDISLPKAQEIVDAVGRTNWIAADNGATWWCFGSKAQDIQAAPYCNNANQGTYAWLFNHLIDCNQAGCTDNSNATAYGYWTHDLIYSTAFAWSVYRSGYLSDTPISSSTYHGVRPVITVLKSNLYQ